MINCIFLLPNQHAQQDSAEIKINIFLYPQILIFFFVFEHDLNIFSARRYSNLNTSRVCHVSNKAHTARERESES